MAKNSICFCFRRTDRHNSFTILHSLPRLHTQSRFGRRHNSRRRVHGGIARRQTDVADQEYVPPHIVIFIRIGFSKRRRDNSISS